MKNIVVRFLGFSIILFLSFISSLYPQQIEYNIYPVSGLNGTRINDSTVVAGKVGYEAGIWEQDTVVSFPFLPGFTYTEVYGMNKLKQMVGMNYYYGTDWVFRATKWENGNTIDLGVLPGFVSSRATGINSNGVIVGNSSMGNVGDITADSSMSFQIVNNNMQMMNIPPGYRGSAAWDINDINSIAGIVVYSDSANSEKLQHAVIWQNGMMSDINGSFNQSQGLSINNKNQVCGWGFTQYPPPGGGGFGEACIWTNGVATKLGILPGYINSYAYGINDSGLVVGECTTGYPTWEVTGFVWKNNTIIDLNTLISPDSGVTITKAVDINNRGQILVRGTGRPYIDTYILKPIGLTITKPDSGALFIAGQKDTIRWENGKPNQDIAIKYSLDGGWTYIEIPQVANTDSGYFVWDVPDDLLSTKAMIKIIDYTTGEELTESELFRIKPYIITKLDENGGYVAYDIQTDRWGFGNTPQDVWPSSWWFGRFNYNNGIDPFTNSTYSQWQGDSVFYYAFQYDHPDWISFVNTFGVDDCYINAFLNIYSSTALQVWKAQKGEWGGSCFGLAISNALAFQKKTEFLSKYPTFPAFVNPLDVTTGPDVIPVINELYTHQFGNPHFFYLYAAALNTSPFATIAKLKTMLSEDSVVVRILSFRSNSTDPNKQGGHAILAYKLEQDSLNPNIYYVYVYDNSYPNLTDARIVVDVEHIGSSGLGLWDPEYGWNGWEGDRWFYLRDPAENYLTEATIPNKKGRQSQFILTDSLLRVYNPYQSDIVMTNSISQSMGISGNSLIDDIPNAYWNLPENGSVGRPRGYVLPSDSYSIIMNNFTDSSGYIEAYIFSGNKTFTYKRNSTEQTQTDRLFFDGGLSIANPDNQTKPVNLMNIINEVTQEKVFILRSINLTEDDSVKILNPDSSNLDLISYGSQKNYQVELEYASDIVLSRFLNDNIALSANTTHKLVPNWGDFANLFLTIYVDEGNNGTIDDTLIIQNQLTDIGEDQGSLIPKEYKLEQNYPNPFNNSTVIKYSVPKLSFVAIKIYDVLGSEVAILVNEEKPTGTYELTWNAANLPSGVYFYRLQAGSFIETKKMILLK